MRVGNHVGCLRYLVCLFAATVGCSVGEDPCGPCSYPGAGAVEGYVRLVDEHGVSASDYGEVEVVLHPSGAGAVTDSRGYWRIPEVPMGTYDVAFTKSGYAVNKLISLPHIGGGTTLVRRVSLPELPGFNVVEIRVISRDGLGGLDIALTVDTVYGKMATGVVVYFFGQDSTVSRDPQTYTEAAVGTYSVDALPVDFTGAASELVFNSSLYLPGDAAIKEGDTVYVGAYSSSWDVVSYFDRATGRSVYTSLGSRRSNVVRVVWPWYQF